MIPNEKISALAGMLKKPHVNSTCIGCSACVAITDWKYFDLDMNGMSIVVGCNEYEVWMVDDAISACPVNAISWQEAHENGEYTHGVQEHQDI
jgi:ferredoxin